MTAAKNVARGRIIAAISSSALSGMFILQGASGVLRGDAVSWIPLGLAVANFIVAVLLARRILQAIP